jgi:hypothetical protein
MGCGGRGGVGAPLARTNGANAYGEIVWSWRRDAGVKSAMMLRITRATVARKPFTGESTI